MDKQRNKISLKYFSKYGCNINNNRNKNIKINLTNSSKTQKENIIYNEISTNLNNDISNEININKLKKINIGEKLYFGGIKKLEVNIKKSILKKLNSKNLLKKENNKNIKNNKNPYLNNIYNKNENLIAKKEKKLKNLKNELQKKEMLECSFVPKINKLNTKLLKSTNKRFIRKDNSIDANLTFKPKINRSSRYRVKSNFFERNLQFSITKKKKLEKEKNSKIELKNIYSKETNKKNKELLKWKERGNVFDNLYSYKSLYKNNLEEKIEKKNNNIINNSICEKISKNSKKFIKNKILNNFKKLFRKLAVNNLIEFNNVQYSLYDTNISDIIKFIRNYGKDKITEEEFINILINNKYLENKKLPEKNIIFNNLLNSGYIASTKINNSISNSKESLKIPALSNSLNKNILLSSDVKDANSKYISKKVVSRLYKVKNPLN